MVNNIAVVGLERDRAYEVTKVLSTMLDMHFFDCIELFEFDNIPRSLATMLSEYGEKYYRETEKGMLKYASGFEETIINLESGMACKENFATIKKNCLLVYLHSPASKVEKYLSKKKYPSKEEKKFFDVPLEKIKKRIEAYKQNADIMVKASSGSALKIASEVLRKIKEFYKVE